MKKGILPLKLFLVIIILGGFAFSFLAFTNGPDGLKNVPQKQLKAQNVGPSIQHLTKIRNNQKTGLINSEDLKVVQDGLDNVTNSRATNMEWTQLGPDNFGGRTRAIHFDNQDTDTPIAYAGAVSGGLWKSVNLGNNMGKSQHGKL